MLSRVILATLLLGGSPCTRADLIEGALLIDGTGAPGRVMDLRFEGGVVVALGELDAAVGETVVDGAGLVLAPGFVDTHSHHDSDDDPLVPAAVTQGITTIVAGQDGGSHFPLADWYAELERSPRAVNVASYSGHGTLRLKVLGDDYQRLATASEVELMADLLAADMESGALGLATGLEYDPGIYSSTEEVIALARTAKRFGGRYISHVRSEDRHLEPAYEELITIGREADIPVQISHMKLARRGLWYEAPRILAALDAARAEGVEVTGDVYPYEYWSSTMTVLFPERDYTDREEFEYVLTELVVPEELIIGRFDPQPEYAGLTLAEIAARREQDPVDTYMALIAELEAAHEADPSIRENIVARSMNGDDIAQLLAWPHSNICSDGSGMGAHPRGHGAFPRVLARYVREEGVLTLEQAIHKMTHRAAQNVGLHDRGLIAVGAPADLVLFDAATISDRASFDAPHQYSVGVAGVWVNGERVLEDGAPTGARPGRVLRR
ncbi:MAG: D-aminoacylase [Pseudomonadales bacterium]|jgi:N-acyl-D-amino-acid deacylase|nr:D-aminoacylase [Pseudomonadales bacterium]